MATAQSLLTAEQYGELPDLERPTELVRGRIVEMNQPYPRHGLICMEIGHVVRSYVKQHKLGYVMCNDSGVITQREPDTVRGPDISFYSHERLPEGSIPQGYLNVSPNLVFEVLSPSDRWARVLEKVGEYLTAGVEVVCVLDPERETMHVYRDEIPSEVLTADDELTIPEVLGEFRVAVRALLEPE
ncbi:MAG: Uma2 family endonuclease [Planctomycetes bacterium]|nr:Uma2 family endonuclease [Planctomycetota bacterium]